jgi:hypothetical protein
VTEISFAAGVVKARQSPAADSTTTFRDATNNPIQPINKLQTAFIPLFTCSAWMRCNGRLRWQNVRRDNRQMAFVLRVDTPILQRILLA